jgi:fructokinase
LENLKDDDPVWRVIGHYLAVFCANLAFTLSPEVIILGGGVMNRKILFTIIQEELPSIFNGYQV